MIMFRKSTMIIAWPILFIHVLLNTGAYEVMEEPRKRMWRTWFKYLKWIDQGEWETVTPCELVELLGKENGKDLFKTTIIEWVSCIAAALILFYLTHMEDIHDKLL